MPWGVVAKHLAYQVSIVDAILIPHHDAHAVTVGGGNQQQVGVAFLGMFHANGHGFLDFGVGIRAGGRNGRQAAPASLPP